MPGRCLIQVPFQCDGARNRVSAEGKQALLRVHLSEAGHQTKPKVRLKIKIVSADNPRHPAMPSPILYRAKGICYFYSKTGGWWS